LTIQEDSPIFQFERHSQFLKIIFILDEKGSLNFQKFIDDYSISSTTLYRTIEALKNLKIVKSEIDSSTYPKRSVISLTQKGKLVAKKLKEIEDILKENES
jgi:DNA-binding HxlR family transcriptional regulator